MFSIEQIKAAHSKVKSGKDFPAYIQEIKELGVTKYETRVKDGSVKYSGLKDFNLESEAKFEALAIANISDAKTFKAELLVHQQGKTDFPTFIKMCASVGLEKWVVRMDLMTKSK